ncbi:MAG TPA: cell envelope integrity protein TolA, partial [Moraxellaceae bacterium]
WASEHPTPMVAELWSEIPKVQPQPVVKPEPPPEPRPEPKPEPKPEPVAPPKPVEPPPVAKEVPKIALPKPVEKKPVPEKPVAKPEPVKPAPVKPLIKQPTLNRNAIDDEMAALQKDMQQAEINRINAEAEKSAQAARATADLAIRDKYQRLINQRVVTKWNRPLTARNGMVTTLRITVLPGGEVGNVVTVKSSGDAAFDASAEEAVRKSSPLPVPTDPTVFNQYFRVITLKFNPEDL